MNKVAFLALWVIVILSLSHAGHAHRRHGFFGSGFDGSFDRTLTVSGPVDLEVSTGSGSIDIRRGTGAINVAFDARGYR